VSVVVCNSNEIYHLSEAQRRSAAQIMKLEDRNQALVALQCKLVENIASAFANLTFINLLSFSALIGLKIESKVPLSDLFSC
jgi:hypothetical protein